MTPTAPSRSTARPARSALRGLSALLAALSLALSPGCGGGGGGGGGGGAPAANPPSGLAYPVAPLLTVGVAMTRLAPTVGGGAPTQYTVLPALPGGIGLDPATGVIDGTPNAVTASATYTVTASNADGSVSTGVLLEVVAAPVTPTAEFVSTAVAAPENAGAVLLTVLLSDIAATDATIPFSVGGTASGADYAISPSPLVIAAGTLSATITLTPVSDGTAEGNETVVVTLLPATGADIGPANVATVTLSDPIQGPCNVSYSDPTIVAGRFAPIVPSTPTVGCGGATGFTILPALPAGLAISATTGAITGTPTGAAQGPFPYTVTATNALGSATAMITIEVEEPLFELSGDDPTVAYNPANGIASGEISITVEELPSASQAGFRDIAGYSFGLLIDSTKLTIVPGDVLEGSDQQPLNGGAGAEFWVVNAVPGGITVGAIFSLMFTDALVADVSREIVRVQFDSVPAFLIGDVDGADVSIPFDGTLGNPDVHVVVTVAGQSADTQAIDPTIHFVP